MVSVNWIGIATREGEQVQYMMMMMIIIIIKELSMCRLNVGLVVLFRTACSL
jgi:hypothetical protein